MTGSYKPKLIEVALPLAAINDSSSREKSIRHGHPSTFHLWWARRPLAAARAVIWASLVDDPSADESLSADEQQRERERLFALLEELAKWENIRNDDLLAAAKAEIDRCYEGPPPAVLDPFGGGGTIPLEAQRLGLQSMSGDLNPVAVLIHRAMLDLPVRFAGCAPAHPSLQSQLGSWQRAQGLAADVAAYAEVVRDEAFARLGAFYPPVETQNGDQISLAWIWARTVPSPDPSWGSSVPLVKSWVLRKKRGKPTIWVEPIVDRTSKTIAYRVREGGSPPDGTVTRDGAVCLATGSAIPFEHIRNSGTEGALGEQLIAVVSEGPTGRSYHSPSERHIEAAHAMDDVPGPPGRLPEGGLGFRVQRYGFTDWASLFTRRQRLTLETFGQLLDGVQDRAAEDAHRAGHFPDDDRSVAEGGIGPRAYGESVATYLAFVLDRCAARWNSLTAWHNGGEKVEHIFRRQAISMNWDYPEPNPFSNSTGNWDGQVTWVTKCIELFPAAIGSDVQQMDAAARVSNAGECIISTDPPYYDNVGYADLSDFYYVWLRESLTAIWPNDLATILTPKAEELIADPSRHGSKQASVEHFESGMRLFFEAVAERQHPSAPATIFYAFKQTENRAAGRSSTGWETFLQALVDAGLTVTATWPIRTEMTGGLRHVGRNSLASSVVLACRAREPGAPLETRGGFVAALRKELTESVALLQSQNIAPVDLAQSAIGPGMRIFSGYERVVEADGGEMTVRTALQLINEALGETLLSEGAELDAESRFALTWFEQFRYASGSFGDADVLARAKDTAVEGVVDAGIAEQAASGVRLLQRHELPEDWSPRTDRRPTDWEATQHLIRQLERSESEAAALLSDLGGLGERARQLAYLLYSICERLDWADEGASYNTLITAWPSLLEHVATADDGQQRLV